jgi:hypothetical protein
VGVGVGSSSLLLQPKTGVTLKEVEISKFSSTGFSSLMGFLGRLNF